MITEIATIDVREGSAGAFTRAVEEALPLFRDARGCIGARLEQCLEEPLSYRLIVRWQTLDDHVVHFRGSAAFLRWRELVSPYFSRPPEVVHTRIAVEGF